MNEGPAAILFTVPLHPCQLLVSVRSVAEAAIALEGGADIIDIKEPARGPLGMADVAVIEAITETIGSRVPVSAALGDIEDPMPATVIAPLAYAKVAMRMDHRGWQQKLSQRFALAPGAGRIVAIYAEDVAKGEASLDLLDRVLDWLHDHRGAGLLLDTRDKAAGDLFTSLSPAQLARIIAKARARNLLIALAGRLAGDSLRRAADLAPDILGVRGAACIHGDRGQSIDAARLREVRSLISECDAPQAQPAKASAAG
ncbi:MAG: (5-formylfuran-3-yl)methyl phosphate synthase [Phycisphaeraceae bacterium]